MQKIITEDFVCIPSEAEEIIPTKFKNYENHTRDEYFMVKNNFYFLFDIADKMKKQFYMNEGIIRNRFQSNYDNENEDLKITRIDRWNQYHQMLLPLAEAGKIELPYIPEHCTNNGHMFYIKAKDLAEREALFGFLKEKDILPASHYVPLHSAPAGLKFGRFHGEDRYTTKESDRLLRLPMYYQLKEEDAAYVAAQVKEFYGA